MSKNPSRTDSTARLNAAQTSHFRFSRSSLAVDLNDVQSQLNPTKVGAVHFPKSVKEIQRLVRQANQSGTPISVCGCKHSMGGQQFGEGNIQFDMTHFNRLLNFDGNKGLATMEAGIQWPKLIADLEEIQMGQTGASWSIRQKQSGVDNVSIGGSLSSNIHGRGLNLPPLVDCVESFRIVNHQGDLIECSRTENAELFSLAIGGYGLFGIVVHVTLRLVKRFKVRRHVEKILASRAVELLECRREQGYVFGDCQFGIDLECLAEEHPAVLPCYLPVDMETPVSTSPRTLSANHWANLYRLTRTDKPRAFELFCNHYLSTNHQVYWSDTHQLSNAFSGYRNAAVEGKGTEVIGEFYVKSDRAVEYLERVRMDLVAQKADITYGTIRLIEPDTETFLPWARERLVCIVVNLHCTRSPVGVEKTKRDFQLILDHTVDFEGSFYLTYHRWATPRHIKSAYPGIIEFFKLKRKYDPHDVFQSSWYRHYQKALG